MNEFITSLFSDGNKVSHKRVLAVLFSLVAVYLLIFEPHTAKLDALFIFISGLVVSSVANKHKAFVK